MPNPFATESVTRAVDQTLKTLDDENRTGLTADITTSDASVVAAKSWRNGWGVAAYARKKWKGEATGGVRVSKEWEP